MTKRVTPFVSDPGGQAFWLERNAQRMDPLQYAREFVQNAVEAGATDIVIDGWSDDETGMELLRFTDNGSGMTEKDLRRHISTLHTQSKGRKNYGIGARVASLYHHPAGVTFASRTKEDGDVMIRVARDQDSYGNPVYGVYNYDVDTEDGIALADVVEPINNELDRLDRKATGTAVILHGDGKSPTWDASVSYAIRSFLAHRYYEWPEGVTVRALHPRTERRHVQFEKVLPLGATLDRIAEQSGALTFSGWDGLDGTMWWWIIPTTTEARSVVPGAHSVSGGIGVLCDGEVFSYGRSYAADFGLVFRSVVSRVVILAEVDGATMDDARGSVQIAGHLSGIPWKKLGRIFAEHMPEEIEALSDQLRVSDATLDEAMAKALDAEWFKRVKPTPVKVPAPTGDATTGTHAGRAAPPGIEERGVNPEPKPHLPPKPRVARKRTADGDKPARLKPIPTLPIVDFRDVDQWDGGDLSVRYVEVMNMVEVRKDHAPYRREVERWAAETKLPTQIVEQAVQQAYKVELAATIIDANYQAVAAKLAPSDVEALRSDAALYTKTLGVQSLERAIKAHLDMFRKGAE